MQEIKKIFQIKSHMAYVATYHIHPANL